MNLNASLALIIFHYEHQKWVLGFCYYNKVIILRLIMSIKTYFYTLT